MTDPRPKGIPVFTSIGLMFGFKSLDNSGRHIAWRRACRSTTSDPWPAAVNWRAPELRVEPPLEPLAKAINP